MLQQVDVAEYQFNANVLPFSQIENLIDSMLHNKQLTRETNGFFKLSKAQKYISLTGAVQIVFNWREITREFLFTVLTGIGVFSEELRKVNAPSHHLIHVLQTEVAVISDDLNNIFPTLQEVAPKGPDGVHYIWWENSIANVIYDLANKKNILKANKLSSRVQKLLHCMVKLSKNKLGAAVQLRVVEAIAQDIVLSYRALFSNMEVDGIKVFPDLKDLAWVNAHIRAEVIHHRQVKDAQGGVSYIADNFEEQQELLSLTEEYIDAWAGALEDFKVFVRSSTQDKSYLNTKTDREKNKKKWFCVICDFTYDEALGFPDEGILPGTAFEDIPDNWVCPDCGVEKSDFVLLQELSFTENERSAS